MIVVAGGTGELGTAVVRRLLAQGRDVAVIARSPASADRAERIGASTLAGDLRDPDSLAGICDGVDAVVATANSIVPVRGERVRSGALTAGYAELARQAEMAGVRRLVFVSVPRSVFGHGAAEFDEKQEVEQILQRHRTPTTVIRPSLFMQSWLPAVGSRLAVVGAEHPTVERGFWLARLVGATMHRSLDRFGVALVPGAGMIRHSFVDVGDVAEVVAASVDLTGPHDELDVGGPEQLSWREIAAIHGEVLGKRTLTMRTPTSALRLGSALLRPVSPPAANLLAAQRVMARVSTGCSPDTAASLLGRAPTSVRDFLLARVAERATFAGVER
ncbi:MAG TPA: NmrA family NAD(P)-binding protein [Marmoricola sp.]|nr:NmrA family NAD(P)-binding protein [Marmoricola sp.]